MRRLAAGDIVSKALGLLLFTVAMLKGYELLTVPVANKDLWSGRPFLIFQVESELALGMWLSSGVFQRWIRLARVLWLGLPDWITFRRGMFRDGAHLHLSEGSRNQV